MSLDINSLPIITYLYRGKDARSFRIDLEPQSIAAMIEQKPAVSQLDTGTFMVRQTWWEGWDSNPLTH